VPQERIARALALEAAAPPAAVVCAILWLAAGCDAPAPTWEVIDVGPSPDADDADEEPRILRCEISSVGQLESQTRCIAPLAVAGDLAYRAADVLQVIDVAQPASLSLLAEIEVGAGLPTGLALDGDLLVLVGEEPALLEVFDLADPLAPRSIAVLEIDGAPLGLDAAGGRAFVAVTTGDETGELLIVSLDVPSRPAVWRRVALGGRPNVVSVHGELALVTVQPRRLTDDPARLVLVDVSISSDFMVRGDVSLPGPGLRRGVTAAGDVAYVAGYDPVLVTVDISNPYSPAVLGDSPSQGLGLGVAVSGSLAYVIGWGSFYVLEVSDTARPRYMISEHVYPYGGDFLELSGDVALVSGGEGGLAAYRVECFTYR
jgi:hypothetical protein